MSQIKKFEKQQNIFLKRNSMQAKRSEGRYTFAMSKYINKARPSFISVTSFKNRIISFKNKRRVQL